VNYRKLTKSKETTIMLTNIDQIAGAKPSRLQRWRETGIAWVSGIAVTAAVFQAIYFMIFAFE
jgi:hypothetical protein